MSTTTVTGTARSAGLTTPSSPGLAGKAQIHAIQQFKPQAAFTAVPVGLDQCTLSHADSLLLLPLSISQDEAVQ